jgi:hypothetical protein
VKFKLILHFFLQDDDFDFGEHLILEAVGSAPNASHDADYLGDDSGSGTDDEGSGTTTIAEEITTRWVPPPATTRPSMIVTPPLATTTEPSDQTGKRCCNLIDALLDVICTVWIAWTYQAFPLLTRGHNLFY